MEQANMSMTEKEIDYDLTQMSQQLDEAEGKIEQLTKENKLLRNGVTKLEIKLAAIAMLIGAQ